MSGMLVLKLSSGCIIAEIMSGVKAMAEEGEGAEVFVYTQNGSVWEQEDCQRQQGDTAKKVKSYRHHWHSIRGKCTHVQLQVD